MFILHSFDSLNSKMQHYQLLCIELNPKQLLLPLPLPLYFLFLSTSSSSSSTSSPLFLSRRDSSMQAPSQNSLHSVPINRPVWLRATSYIINNDNDTHTHTHTHTHTPPVSSLQVFL
ncbi:Hypothetical predicted protein [Scomber scombrus]|uniref:Uncharacterized protein n=1 Tax=Scomber scombrus TaxID=13677 RepID=A0AAV1Q3P5_SCOSC